MSLSKYCLLLDPSNPGVEFIERTQPPIIVGIVVKGGNNDITVEYFETLDKSSFTDDYLQKQLKKMNDFYKYQIQKK